MVRRMRPRLTYPDATVASQKTKRRTRKRRGSGAGPRVVPSPRREERAERQAVQARVQRRSQRQLGTEGPRPEGPFGGLPVSEFAIFAGLVAIVVWLIRGGTATLIVGLVLITLAVLEFTAREHFSGYRSHATLLAAVPAVAIAVGVVGAIGTLKTRAPLLIAVAAPIFTILFWFLRKRFLIARQERVARPPGPAQ
jgi:hypothetical protein